MPPVIYAVECLKERKVNLGKGVELTLLRKRGLGRIELRKPIDPLNVSRERVRNLLKRKLGEYVENCDYVLLRDDEGKREFCVSLRGGEGPPILYPRPSRLHKVFLLKKQERMEMEENIVFSRLLTKEEVEVPGRYFVWAGQVRIPEDAVNVVGIGLVTDTGSRVILREEGIGKVKAAPKAAVSRPKAASEKETQPEKKSAKTRKSSGKAKKASKKSKKKKKTGSRSKKK